MHKYWVMRYFCDTFLTLKFLHLILDVILQPQKLFLTLFRCTSFILHRGEVSVFRNGQKTASLTEGDFFGEVSLMLDCTRVNTVKAVTWCDMMVLSKVCDI